MIRKNILLLCGFLCVLISCNRDYKRETVLGYLKYIHRLSADNQLELTELKDVSEITKKDSLDMLIKKYSHNAKSLPSIDSVLILLEKDIAYNANLLYKTRHRIDSLAHEKHRFTNDSFYAQYSKSFEELKDFTEQQLIEQQYEQYLLKKYSTNQDNILAHQLSCQYKVKATGSDSSKIKQKMIFLSADGKRVVAVR